jgi:hypothetical protein
LEEGEAVTDHKELLKKLVDVPFGEAEKILKSKGFWDEKRAPNYEAKLKRYHVKVSAYRPATGTLYVDATSLEEAKKLAREEAPNTDWDYDYAPDDIRIDSVEETDEEVT